MTGRVTAGSLAVTIVFAGCGTTRQVSAKCALSSASFMPRSAFGRFVLYVQSESAVPPFHMLVLRGRRVGSPIWVHAFIRNEIRGGATGEDLARSV